MEMWITLVLVTIVLNDVHSQQPLNIGAHKAEEEIMQRAIAEEASLKFKLLPVEPQNELDFDTINTLGNRLARDDYQAVIGAFEHNIAIPAEKVGIPYLVRSFGSASTRRENTFYLFPSVEDICDCVLDIVKAYGWEKMAIFYEDFVVGATSKARNPDPLYHSISDAMMLGKLLQDPSKDLRVWKVKPGSTLKDLKAPLLEVRELGITQLLVLTPSATVDQLLQQARRLGMAALPYSWIFLNLGSDDFVGPILADLASNVTSVNLVKVQDEAAKKALEMEGVSPLKYSILLDSIKLLAEVADDTKKMGMPFSGENLISAIRKTSTYGHTGVIEFDAEGRRTNYSLNIYNYFGDNVSLVAEWNNAKATPLSLVGKDGDVEERAATLEGRTVKIVSILETPWLMLKDDHAVLTGNDKYIGFVPDMMDEVSKMMGFSYELYLVPDGNFGSLMDNGEWNGMIQEVLNGNASMTVAPLSINSQRELAIDFTKPFFTRYLNALVKTHKEEPNFFQFMQPFSSTVWYCIIGATGIVCVILFILERYSTSLRSEGDDTPDMSASESLWFTLAAILQQGGETTPATPAGRIVAAFWWFFGLIIITSYTANLTAFLTVKNINAPISSIADLSTQTKVKFGTVKNSGVENFFKYTKVEPYRTMWEQMVVLDSNVNSTNQGVELVQNGDYAFIWDSSVTSYKASMDCELTTIGPAFDHKGFGIALPPGTAYRDEISYAILKLIDAGLTANLEDKWWSGVPCPGQDAPTAEETAELTVHHVAGIYITLTLGLILAALACLLDQLVKHFRKQCKKSKKDPMKNGSESSQPLNHFGGL